MSTSTFFTLDRMMLFADPFCFWPFGENRFVWPPVLFRTALFYMEPLGFRLVCMGFFWI